MHGNGVDQDYKEASKLFEKATMLENSIAMINMGYLYESGLGIEKNYVKASRLYEEAAIQGGGVEALFGLDRLFSNEKVKKIIVEGRKNEMTEEVFYNWDPYSMNNLGYMFHYGILVNKVVQIAETIYKSAIKKGSISAIHNLGVMYKEEEKIKDLNKSKRLLLESATKGYSTSYKELAKLFGEESNYTKQYESLNKILKIAPKEKWENFAYVYKEGVNIRKPHNIFEAYMQKEKDKEIGCVLKEVGWMNLQGRGTEKNELKGKNFLEQAIEYKNKEAMFQLGMLYYSGLSVPYNIDSAEKLLIEAADNGHVPAMNLLGDIYSDEADKYTDYSKAKKYYEQAVSYNCVTSKHKLGLLYIHGKGVEQDYTKAKNLLEEASQKYNPDTLITLASLYENGLGTSKDLSKAFELYKEAGIHNREKACDKLGDFYAHGIGVEQNYYEAREWYKKNIYYVDSPSLSKLGVLYLEGKGGEKDYIEAKRLFMKSLDALSLYNLGKIYTEGLGVEIDHAKGIELYKRAADKGNQDAIEHLAEMNR